MKKILIAIFSCLTFTVSAQEIIVADNDTYVSKTVQWGQVSVSPNV